MLKQTSSTSDAGLQFRVCDTGPALSSMCLIPAVSLVEASSLSKKLSANKAPATAWQARLPLVASPSLLVL